MDIFNIDNLLNDIPNEAVIDNPRPQTPAPYEHDAIMSPSFDTSPQVPRRAPSATRDMSPEISSQVPVSNIEHSETADTNMANSTTIQGTDDAFNVPNNPREPLSEDPHNSRGRVELEPPVQRPARDIVEDTSYDDDESIIGASAPLKIASRLPDSEPSRKVEVFGPFQSIFGGGPLIENKTSTGQPRKAMTTVRKTPIVIDDDDDDIIVIEQETASQEARNKWSSQRKRKVPSTGFHKEMIPKKEKTNDVSFSNCYDNSQLLSPPPTQLDTQSQNSEYLHQLPQNTIFTPNASQVFESRSSKDAQSNPSPFQKNKDIMSIIAAQQAMVNKGQSRHNSPFPFQVPTSLASRVPAPRPSEAESSSAAAARNPAPFVSRLTLPRIPEKVTSPLEASQHDPAQMDFSVRQPREDHSWMEEGYIEDETYEDLITKGDVLSKKEKAGTLNPEQKMVLFKIRRDIELKERLMAAARHAVEREEEEDGEDSLFVPDRRDPPRRIHSTQNHGLADDSDSGERDVEHQHEGLYRMMQEEFGGGSDEPEDLGFTKSGKPRKRRLGTKRATNAREYFNQQQENREKERSKVQKKKCREPPAAPKNAAKSRGKPPKGNTKESSRSRGKGKGKAQTKNGNGTGRGKKKGVITNGASLLNTGEFHVNRGNYLFGQLLLDDLVNNNPIDDRLHARFDDVEPEPEIHGKKRKETQFQALFANIPQNEYATSSGVHDKKKLREASKSFGYAKCKAQDGKWLIKGMKSTLYHHQLLGAQWMVQRELSPQPPHGGLLADVMGLGKTVQTLACMVANPPGPADVARNVKTTLIVVPAAVLTQWVDEIGHHCEAKTFPKIMRYKSSNPVSRAVLEDLDIVITTYHEVMREFPFPDKDGREEISRVGYQQWWRNAIQNLGTLHQISWYRVVLDEAQAIKNNNARTSLACQNLKSIYRWCLTGTPLLNRLEELFPYLRFLKANYSMDWQTFQKYFCDPNADKCYSRIATLLSYTMMRRTMKTTILNRPIITLPPPHPELKNIQFSPEEAIIYRITENRFRSNLNTYFAKGEARRNYGVFMVQLLRLRQCTSHPFMLERTIRESWNLEDVEELRDKLSKLGRDPKPFYENCKVWTEEVVRKRNALKEEDAPDEYTEIADELIQFGQSIYGHKFNIDKALKSISEKDLYDRVVCGICSDLPSVPVKGDCGHMFCEECLNNYMGLSLTEGVEPDFIVCPTCHLIMNNVQKVKKSNLPHTVFNPFHSEDDDDNASSGAGTKGGKGSKEPRIHPCSKGRDELGFEPWTAETWLTRSDIDDTFPLTPSAKTTALKAVLLKGFKDAPVDKVVIYVQFRTLARIVGRICKGEGWGFLYLTGDSSIDHRNKVIKKFREDDNVKILIAGLKCGGVGLNFPWANRCISLDLWWNHAVEQQAFGRIFRIGQTKDTYMTRIVVKNSVDQRMLTMQMHKLKSLERAIRDRPEKPSLTLNQLSNLFGFLRTNEDGEIVSIEADYQDEIGDDESGSSSFDSSDPRSSFGTGRARIAEKDEDDSGEEDLMRPHGMGGFGSSEGF